MFKLVSVFLPTASVGGAHMDGKQSSVAMTPADSAVVQRRNKSKYRLSYRSGLGAASRLCLTPALTTRRLSTSRKAPKINITENVSPEHVALLMKTEWQLSYVTPLYQFRHTQLKNYSRQLAAFLAAEKQQGLAVEVEGLQSSFTVCFSVLQGMVMTDDDPETVLIQIQSKPVFPKKNEPQKPVWSGWLTCINGNVEYLRSLPKDFTCLPLFCSSGPEAFTSVIKSWLQQNFDCCFGQLEISHTSLQWLMALWTNCHAESGIQHLKMIWTLPAEPPLQVTYMVEPQDAWVLWNSLRNSQKHPENTGDDPEEDNIDIGEVKRFVQALKSHFYRHFRLDLSAGRLSQVSTGLGSAKCNGRIKMSNSRYMITTLMLLTECALFKMPI
ncbi:centromere protein L [Takifugu flavidus]|uniref:Centromere protein L n=2 Tax=Takifugu TaxID=31032 RepID=A0A5C6NAG0_9TELE|nr:centromere protein L [Takifugu flavidus]TWW64156.1 Centromere protein L [Takifugu flavidus]